MPVVVLAIPLVAVDPIKEWTNRSAILSNDSSAAEVDAALTGAELCVRDWEDIIPAGSDISGVTATVSAYGSVAGLDMEIALTRDGETAWGDWQDILDLTTSTVNYVVGGASNEWGNDELTLSSLRRNENFGVLLRSKGGSGTIYVQYLYLQVHYTTSSALTLTGSRSVFPREVDTMVMAKNGAGPENQVRTGDKEGTANSPGINFLGDCLFNIQKTLVQQGDVVRALGNPPGHPLYFFAITITGTVDTSHPCLNWEAIVHEDLGQVKVDSVVASPNLLDGAGDSTVQRTWPCLPGTLLNFDFVSGFGWCRTEAGALEHLCVTPKTFMAVNDGRHWGYYMGFTASTLSADRALLLNDGYRGVRLGFEPASPGTFVIKLLAIGTGFVTEVIS